jgi:hypothetical protein
LTNLLRKNAGEVGHAQVRVTFELDIQHRLSPEVDSEFRDLCPCKPGRNEPKYNAENCARVCYRPQATPSVSEQSGRVG